MKERIVVIMSAYNAVKALERIYRIIMTRYFEKASSVNCYRSVIYGFATLWMLVKFIVHKWGAEVPRFSKQLRDAISRYHQVGLFREVG